MIKTKNIYIDESGSMTTEYCKYYPYFVIALIVPIDKNKAKRVFKRYISKNEKYLKSIDSNNKMFKGNTFVELKGSAMDEQSKMDFLDYFCRNNLLQIYYIKINNSKIKYGLYNNTARAFNFVIKQALRQQLKENLLPKDDYYLCIDERNEKTKTRYLLEEYLNMQLIIEEDLVNSIKVDYFDSSNNCLVQVADVFSNIFYNNCFNNKFEDKLVQLRESGYIRSIFLYP